MEADVVLWVAAGVAILSEVIALVPSLQSNSMIQLIMNIGKRIAGKK